MPLTKERAEFRSAHIKKESVSYDLHLSVQTGNHYSGITQIAFELQSIPTQLAIDYQIQQISKILVNHQLIETKTQPGFILLDVTKLKEGKNNVAICYRNKYDNDGQGMVSFVDVDQKQYLYTQFQPYYCNRVFPLFDQPDLKAKMRLNVLSPADWKKVLSNEKAIVDMKPFNQQEYIEKISTNHKDAVLDFIKDHKGNMTLFPKTKLLPPYLYCLVAGAYEQLVLQQTYKNIPMSLFCIESLFEHLKRLAPFIFEITIQSMKLFESFFGYDFAFNKYDQIFAHQYKWGAMQNAGIVTFNDLYIWKEKVSTQKMLNLANTISHQLAHHWFGNLVTMKWWDDLWLNESFADFISHFCLQKIKNNCKTINYESAMASFLHRKAWGYHEDQMITTHPIRGPVPNTTVADSIFDGITYAKGASTMKQLLFLMKEQNFSKALSAYFHKYNWNNATLDDFIAEMQKVFPVKQFSLQEWKGFWLQTASLNQIDPSWNQADKSQNAKITIKMSPITQNHPTLRPHKIKIGLFKEDLSVDVIQTLIFPKQINEVQYDGSRGYKAILLNYQDHTFIKNNIDLVSRQFFTNNLDKINDILSRTLIWRSFFEMVKDAVISTREFVSMVIKNIQKQTSDSIFQKQFEFIAGGISSYTPSKYRQQLSNQVFAFIIQLISRLPEGNNNRAVILKSKLPQFAKSKQNKNILIKWRQGNFQPLKNHSMTVGQEWSTVVKAFTLKQLSLEEKQKLFENQKNKDPSDTAKLKRYTCDAIKANKEEFMKLYEDFKNPKNENSISTKNAINAGWSSEIHQEQHLSIKQQYFKDIQLVANDLKGDHFDFFVTSLQPNDDDLEGTIKGYQNIKLQGQKFDKIRRDILKIIDNLKRRLKTYATFEQKSKL